MSDPSKLREGDDFAARLLRAGSREHPGPAARSRAERALGLSTLAAGVALTTTVQASAAAAASAATSAPLALVTFAKWAAVGLLMGSAAAGGVSAWQGAFEPASRAPAQVGAPVPIPSAHPRANVAPPRAEVPEQPAATGDTTVAPEARPVATPPVVAAPQREPLRSVTPATSANNELALSREIELLERVRGKLRSGNSADALSELERVRGDIRALSSEAELLRIEALIAHGERPRAEELAAELQRRDPRWTQNFRLKRLLGAR